MGKIWYFGLVKGKNLAIQRQKFGYSKTQLALNHPAAAPLPSLAVTWSPWHLGGSLEKPLEARGAGELQGLIVE